MNKHIIKAIKAAIACCLSIFVAESLGLDYSGSAGIVALLTIADNRTDTFILVKQRIFSFLIAMIIAIIMFEMINIHWITFGIFIFLVIICSYRLKIPNTISINAVIGTHILFNDALTFSLIINEFCIIFIGSMFAIIFNMIFFKKQYELLIKKDIHFIEESFQDILFKIAEYLFNKGNNADLWNDINKLDKYLLKSMELAIDNKKNIMKEHSHYYIDYMNMRIKQVNILKNIHFKLDNMTEFPNSAIRVAYFIYYLVPYVKENNIPNQQIEIFNIIKNEVIKDTKEDFENKAILYGIILDLKEFLNIKCNFINNIDDVQLKIYWN